MLKNLLSFAIPKWAIWLLVAGAVFGAYKVWEHRIATNARFEVENEQLEAEIRDMRARWAAAAQDRVRLKVVVDSVLGTSTAAEAAADTLHAQLAGAQTASDSVKILVRENSNLRVALDDQKAAVAALKGQVVSLESDLKESKGLNVDLERKYEQAFKRSNPGLLGRLTRDLPEKLAWSVVTLIVYSSAKGG